MGITPRCVPLEQRQGTLDLHHGHGLPFGRSKNSQGPQGGSVFSVDQWDASKPFIEKMLAIALCLLFLFLHGSAYSCKLAPGMLMATGLGKTRC